MPQKELEILLATLLRSRALSRRMGPLVHALLLAQLLAGSAHEGPPHAPARGPGRSGSPARAPLPRRGSITGRRPRG